MSDFYRYYDIDMGVQIVISDLLSRITEESLQKPSAYIEIIDTDDTVISISTCTDFRVSTSIGDGYGEFNCTLKSGSSWNLLGAAEKLKMEPDLRRRVNIYYGQLIEGSYIYEQIFTGIPFFRPESYQHGSLDQIVLRGYSPCWILNRTDGAYSSPNFTGTSKELIEYWLVKAGLSYYVDYTDIISMDDEPVSYTTMVAGIGSLVYAHGPRVQYWANFDGSFNVLSLPTLESEIYGSDIEYTEDNMKTINPDFDGGSVITNTVVTGSGEISTELQASNDMILQYGINSDYVSSALIDSQSDADSIAADVLLFGKRYINNRTITMTLNPYLKVGQVLDVSDNVLSGISGDKILVESVAHVFRAGSIHESEIAGYKLL